MDDEVVQRAFQEGGRDYFQQQPSTSTSSSSSILQSLPLHVSFDHGYYLLVKSIQELREKKEGLVTVGIGGPSGSGKTSLAEKVASVFGCTVIPMENYRYGIDEGTDLDSIDFDALIRNLEDLTEGKDTMIPVFDFQQKKHAGSKAIKSAMSGVVIVDGIYALHAKLRSLLDIRVAVVGGVHFSILSKVRYDIRDSCSLDYLIDSIFPLFRKHIEPDLHHAQIRINNSFVSSFREATYKLKCRSESPDGHSTFFLEEDAQTDNFIEMYLRPPCASEETRINDWIKVRQSGIRYYLSLGDQRIVEKYFIIRPKTEFEVGRMTLGGLLALGYNVVVSYKRASTSVNIGSLSLSFETIDALGETFLVLRGTDRKLRRNGKLRKKKRSWYINWVNHILEHHKGFTLNEFRVCFDLDWTCRHVIDNWFRFAISKKVQKLEFNFEEVAEETWPLGLRSYSLTKSCFDYIQTPPGLSCIGMLNSLCLRFVKVSGEVLEHFLMHCPLLEKLAVEWSKNLVSLKVASPLPLRLRCLEIRSCIALQSLKISASNLQSFRYYGQKMALHIENAPVLADVLIGGNLDDEPAFAFSPLSSYLCQLETLTLEMSPLKIWGSSTYNHAHSWSNVTGKLIPSLKVVEVIGFKGFKIDVDLVTYLLEHGKMMEKMSISCCHPSWIGQIWECESIKEREKARKHALQLQSKSLPTTEFVVI